jgi:hypothetical protein
MLQFAENFTFAPCAPPPHKSKYSLQLYTTAGATRAISGGIMCTNGVNTGQFEQMIEQIDDHIKIERRWAHNLAHQAEDAGFATVGAKLHHAQALLDEVRAALDDAKDALEDDAEAQGGVTVSLV